MVGQGVDAPCVCPPMRGLIDIGFHKNFVAKCEVNTAIMKDWCKNMDVDKDGNPIPVFTVVESNFAEFLMKKIDGPSIDYPHLDLHKLKNETFLTCSKGCAEGAYELDNGTCLPKELCLQLPTLEPVETRKLMKDGTAVLDVDGNPVLILTCKCVEDGFFSSLQGCKK
jgi:hypothetical protein